MYVYASTSSSVGKKNMTTYEYYHIAVQRPAPTLTPADIETAPNRPQITEPKPAVLSTPITMPLPGEVVMG